MDKNIPLPPEGISRRRFLALMSATAAVAAAAGCSEPDRGAIVPFTRNRRKGSQDPLPGVAARYASTFQEGARSYGILIKTREGRPLHIEGNDKHPISRGKTSPRAIAEILNLYDPDRLRTPLLDGRPATQEEAEKKIVPVLEAARDGKKPVLLLSGAILSPTAKSVIADFKKILPTLEHAAWEPGASESERQALKDSFGDSRPPRLHLEHAKVIVSFEDDFLAGDRPELVAAFASRRRPDESGHGMNRLWAFEGGESLTGAKADQRLALRPTLAAAAAFALARDLKERHGKALPTGVGRDHLAYFTLERTSRDTGIPVKTLRTLTDDLAKAGKDSLVVAGASLPTPAHTACHLLNAMLGAEGRTMDLDDAPETPRLSSLRELNLILESMARGKYSAVIIWGVNPGYSLPDRDIWNKAVTAATLTVRIGLHADETAEECRVVLPESHWLEGWGDYEVSSGTLSLQQPAIEPLYDTLQGETILLKLIDALGGSSSSDLLSHLKKRWKEEVYPAGSPVQFDRFWLASLHDGVVRQERTSSKRRRFNGKSAAAAAESVSRRPETGMELLLRPGAAVFDGRGANNGWLQELPDPVTKLTWGNALSISPADARKLSLEQGDIARLEYGGRSAEIPVIVAEGAAQGVASSFLGYGRRSGSIAQDVGANLFPFVGADSRSPLLLSGLNISATGRKAPLPLTQTHHKMEGRDIARSMTVSEAAHHRHRKHELHSLYKEQQFPDHHWGMAIDLSACTGCSGCVVACQSENNIPSVGPEQVLKGREMHWMRVDRYTGGGPSADRTVNQPMLCQQCDNAPCENVCPVFATSHSPEGLNQMTYNRCVGTRYCANNCPYKVRRFNFFEYTAGKQEPESLAYNPEVTVRPRGVMEKCTFCVQRIQDSRRRAKGEKRALRDGEITPACAAACPAEAIVFGDLNDPESRVSKLSKNKRGYHVLEELGVLPSITYLAELTNPAVPKGGAHG